jgi:hypothetical protein
MTCAVTSPAGSRETGPTATATATYEIRVAGHLDDHWSATLGDLTLVRLDDGTTSLAGSLVDQAQLHSVLAATSASRCLRCAHSTTPAHQGRPGPRRCAPRSGAW